MVGGSLNENSVGSRGGAFYLESIGGSNI
jgi:hypothetical protein